MTLNCRWYIDVSLKDCGISRALAIWRHCNILVKRQYDLVWAVYLGRIFPEHHFLGTADFLYLITLNSRYLAVKYLTTPKFLITPKSRYSVIVPGALLLTRITLNPIMDKNHESHAQCSVEINYLTIPKLQRNYLLIPKLQQCDRWRLEWTSNVIPHFIMNVITSQCRGWSQLTYVRKRGLCSGRFC